MPAPQGAWKFSQNHRLTGQDSQSAETWPAFFGWKCQPSVRRLRYLQLANYSVARLALRDAKAIAIAVTGTTAISITPYHHKSRVESWRSLL